MPYCHLNRKEREMIAFYLEKNLSIRKIALKIGRSPSTVSRELKRNSPNGYNPEKAYELYKTRRENCRRRCMYEDIPLALYITEKLLSYWSPEQIAKRMLIDNCNTSVSFSSIYRWLNKGLFPRAKALKAQLRRHKKYKKRNNIRNYRLDAKTIHERDKSVLLRERYGNWEFDTVVFGSYPSQRYILVGTERKSRYTAMVLLPDIKRISVMAAFESIFGDGVLALTSVTSDRGMEFRCHNEFEKRFGVNFYYTDRGKPYQKPTVETTNGFIRQFLPKGTAVKELTDNKISEIAHCLNNRPRKVLGFRKTQICKNIQNCR